MKKPTLRWLWWIAATLSAATLAAWFSLGAVFTNQNEALYDMQLESWLYAPNNEVVIIAIDDGSMLELGQWPWPRNLHAKLLDRLTEAGVRGVALDLFFSEPDRSGKSHDTELAEAMVRNGHTTLPVTAVTLSQHAPPIESLPTPLIASAAATLGHTDVEVDSDGVIRGLWLEAGLGDPLWRALGLALIGQAPELEPNPLPGLRNPDRMFASPYLWSRDHYVRIHYAGPPGTFPQVSYVDVLEGRVPAELLRGRWVVIGVTATGVGTQRYLTPMSSQSMTGAEYHANIIEMLLHDKAIVPLSMKVQIALTILLVLVTVWIMLLPSGPQPWLTAVAACLITLGGSILLLRFANLWFPPMEVVGSVALACLLWVMMRLRHWQRQAHMDALTNLANRRRFDHMLLQEISSARRNQFPLSLALIDIDYFKAYNDTQGHRAGDRVLHQVAELIASHARRPRDVAARFGGDEFAMILPDTPAAGAISVAEDLIDAVRALSIPHGGELTGHNITITIGLYTCIPGPHTHPRNIFDGADAALYQAKAEGRDRYCADSDTRRSHATGHNASAT